MKTFYSILVFSFYSTILFSTIINVPSEQPTIQAGIDVAVATDTVLVQSGTYLENINYNGKNITIASLFVTTQDTSYISQTIIDGNQNGSVITFESGEDSTTVLSGFTITNGLGGGSYPNNYGGGITCSNLSSPNLVNLQIIGNISNMYGGGVYCRDNSNLSLEDVKISGNSASYGGGVSFYESNPSLINITLTNNSASENGGGIYCSWNSSAILNNVVLTGNTAGYGGGIYCSNSNPNLVNITLYNNSVNSSGGGIYLSHSDPSIINTVIKNNYATSDGGGIRSCALSNPSFLNVTIIGNSAGICTGGISSSGNSNLLNVTIVANSAGEYGAGGISSTGNTNLLNSIIWDNSPNAISGSVTATYSNIEGGWTGEGNLDSDPLFVGSGDHPFMLQDLSPCVNYGTPDTTGLNLPELDLAGNPRIYGVRIDMGAYENQNIVTGVDENSITNATNLYQNFPNPFNPTTTINYSLLANSKVSLNIYNINGQKVKQLVYDQLSAGQHTVVWNGKDENNKSVSSGIYFYKLKSNNYEKTKKMILLK